MGGDKRFPTSSKKCLRRINFDDLQQTIMRALDPAKMEVILVGDFDPKEAEMVSCNAKKCLRFDESMHP